MMALKQFNVKQAERWLQKLRTQNAQSYKELIKFLRKYQKCQDEHECYLKMSHTLLPHAELTRQLNGFLEEGNKFIVTRPDDEKLRDFMSYVKKNRPAVFQKIISMIQELNKSKGQGNHDVSKLILPKLKEIIEGDQELERLIEEAIDMKDEELIKRKNLEHLKVNRPPPPPVPEEPKDTYLSESYVPRQRRPYIESKNQIIPEKKDRKLLPSVMAGGFTNTNEERLAISQMEKSIEYHKYRYITKIFKIYSLNLISRKEAISLINNVGLEDIHFENIKEILETRQLDRRKQSWYKPLSDINFNNAERASPSYVAMPFFYPIKCSGKSPEVKLITNDKWISVPSGSEENENFSVRNKNMNEINLLKAEDERYEFDLYFKKLSKTKDLIDSYLDQSNGLDELQRLKKLKLALSLGTIQLIYKNCREDQKEQLENFIKHYPRQTCRIFKNKIDNELIELTTLREIHAIKAWNQIANKNFFKALDLKGFEFKKNEKLKMKNQNFISQLNDRNKILANGGDIKPTTLSFEDKKNFFSILNSFQCSSRVQKCNSRQLPSFEIFDLKDDNRRQYYPIMILAFEDQGICDQVYTFLIYYIENSPMSDGQKLKNKLFLQQFLTGYLKWRHPTRRYPNQKFQQEQLMLKINNSEMDYIPEDYITTDPEPLIFRNADKKMEDQKNKKNMKVMQDKASRYSYLPERSQKKKVLYGSEQLYSLVRFLYAIYERLIKMREVSQGTQNLQLFELLFYTSIKVKESIKFEQTLNALFGKYAYLFSTIYKLFDSVLKAVVMSSSCLLTGMSFKLVEQNISEDHEILLVNRYCLQNNLTINRIVRFTFDEGEKVLYLNYFDSYYKTDEVGKDMIKKRIELSRGVEIYTTEFYRGDNPIRKPTHYLQRNRMEYLFQSNTLKLQNHTESEDVMLAVQRPQEDIKNYMKEMKRVHQLNAVTH